MVRALNLPTIEILGLPVSTLPRVVITSLVNEWLTEVKRRTVVTLNPEIALKAQKDPTLLKIIQAADLVVPDGFGITWAARRMHKQRLERIPGIELAESLLTFAAHNNYPAFFLGSNPGVAEQAAKNLAARWPGLKIHGTHSGYFSAGEQEQLGRELAETTVPLLMVGMGAGLQEKIIASFPSRAFRVALGIGGSLEVWAGRKHRAPHFFQLLSLEWLYRVVTDPRRFVRLLLLFPFFWRILWFRHP
ncbi:MAG: WecB/TagA/CpsF family glycosyltransferase [Coprothermobacterota bacterium]|nr:WecB/TagA/CpsF family glycosyltransferase [Coprothermobacterota bacterium]